MCVCVCVCRRVSLCVVFSLSACVPVCLSRQHFLLKHVSLNRKYNSDLLILSLIHSTLCKSHLTLR